MVARRKRRPPRQVAPSDQDLQEELVDGLKETLALLTDEQIDQITPLEIMAICAKLAIREGNWARAFVVAQAWAPYVHPKLAPKLIEGSAAESRVTIIGGLPDLDDAREAEVVEGG